MIKDDQRSESRSTGRSSNIIKVIIADARDIYRKAMKLSVPDLNQVNLERGFEVSRLACSQPSVVYCTALGTSMFKSFEKGNTDDWKLTVDMPLCAGEKWLDEQIKAGLLSVNGPKVERYNESAPLYSIDHYNVDCYQAYKENARRIQPGQEEQRRELAKMFTQPMDPEPIFRLFETDRVAQLALEVLLDAYPSVVADRDFKDTSQPFENKDANVSAPFWQNDRNPVPDRDGLTYGQLCIEIAKELTFRIICEHYNLNTYYGRNQIKGRLIAAMSRPVNIYFNRLEHPEIEALKHSNYFIGYGDENQLKEGLISILDFCERRGFKCKNFDQSKYDMHINPAFLAIVGALRAEKAADGLGKRLAKERAMLNIHSYVVNGMTNKVEEIFGRMTSGYIDTNQGDGLVEILLFMICLMWQDNEYKRKIALASDPTLLVMGDDALVVYDPQCFDESELVSKMKDPLGFEVNPDKGEYGVFFLQNRLFRKDGKDIMVYPWPRVLYSMIYSERSKGLGQYGWLLAQYQQLHKLEQYEPALDAVVKIIYPFDKLKLGVDLSVDQILQGLKAEDLEAQQEQKPHRYSPTVKKLFDGDPTKNDQYVMSGTDIEISTDYLSNIHAAVVNSVRRLGRANMRNNVHKPVNTETSSDI